MASIFEQLGYDYTPSGNEITTFTGEVLESLEKLPPLLSEWQYEDLRNEDSDVTNYMRNPVANVGNDIKSTAAQIKSSCTGISELITIYESANTLYYSANSFIMHTNRISGLVQPNEDTALLPHYDMAIGIGKMIMYLVYQSDNIQNNAPILGSFTSLFIENELINEQSSISNYSNIITSSITCTTSGDPPETICSSNLSSETITTIENKLNDITNILDTRRNHDENYYANSTAFLEKYEEMKRYSNPGQTEKDMFNNFIGTERLKNNIT